MAKNKKLFSMSGLITIFFLLFFGLGFVFFEKTYFPEDKQPVQVFKIPPIKKYRIGFMTDAHSRVTKKGLIRPESKIPMLNFVSEMNNNFHPFFVVDGGDFIDGTRRFGSLSMKDYSAFSEIFKTIEAPKYQVLGNHELRGMTRENWNKLNNYKNSYYYFDYDKLRVIVFDSTLTPESENSVKIPEYNKQLLWLENLLKNSDGYKKIIFTHYPFISLLRKKMPIERVEEFNKIASEYGVRAVFCGHVEFPYYEKIGGVEYFVVPGFFRSEAIGMIWKDSFSEIRIGLRNNLKIFYKREDDNEYRTVVIPSAEYEEIKKEIMSTVDFMAPSD